ncbi:MAG: GYD domain-containing protein [Patescibacteria group bacterium]|jgi:uncharacterized protein with GYD domain
MATYILLTNLGIEACGSNEQMKSTLHLVEKRLKEECRGVTFVEGYGCMGTYDLVYILESEEPQTIEKVVPILRELGHSTIQTMLATPFEQFIKAL